MQFVAVGMCTYPVHILVVHVEIPPSKSANLEQSDTAFLKSGIRFVKLFSNRTYLNQVLKYSNTRLETKETILLGRKEVSERMGYWHGRRQRHSMET